MSNIELLESLHDKILKSSFAEIITENEMKAFVDCKEELRKIYNQALNDISEEMEQYYRFFKSMPSIIYFLEVVEQLKRK